MKKWEASGEEEMVSTCCLVTLLLGQPQLSADELMDVQIRRKRYQPSQIFMIIDGNTGGDVLWQDNIDEDSEISEHEVN